MKLILPPTLLSLLHLALPALSHASPQPAFVRSDWDISLIPRNTLFLRQLSNLQTFEQALGGTRASSITQSGDPQRPFSVDGQTFDSFNSAAQRSCDNQFQECQKAANGNGNGNGNANANANANANTNNRNGNGNGNANGNGNGNSGDGKNRQASKNKPKKEKRQNQGGGGLTVQQCDQQKTQCNSAQQSAQVKSFETGLASTNIGPDPQFPDFDLICEG